jgi:predicted Zn-dependent protease
MLGYGREKEYLADSQAINYMYAAGYDPLQMAKFQINLSEISQGPVGYAQYLSTHPDIFDRINRAEAQAKVTYAMHDAFSNRSNGDETSQKRSMKRSRALILADEYKVHLDGLAYGPRDRIRQIKIYTVRKGETLRSIAANKLDEERELREIAFLNGLDIDAQLYPGQKIKLVY